MLRTAFALMAAVLLFSSQAFAQTAEDELFLSGFRLGKYHASAAMLAGELMYLTELCDVMEISEMTDENYDAGIINDDDIENASITLAYAIWRVQFMILPLSEAGLDGESFVDPIFEDLRDATMFNLEILEFISADFLDDPDFTTLAAYCYEIDNQGLIEEFMGLAEVSREMAGEED